MRRTLHLVLFLICLALPGCYTYRGGTLPSVDPASITASVRETKVVYRVRVESNVGDDDKIDEMAVRSLVASLQRAGADIYPMGQLSDPDLDLLVEVLAKGSIGEQMLSGFVSGLTFGLFPGYAHLDFETNAIIEARDGTEYTYAYRDSSTTWIQILLLFFTNDQERIVREIIDDTMRSLARDMQRDELLPSAASAQNSE